MKKLLATLLATFSLNAYAIDLTIQGTVSTSCYLAVNQGGTFAMNPADPTALSTSVPGGQPGVVGVTYTGTPSVTVTLPTTFTTSPSLTFTPTFSGTVVSGTLGNLTVTNSVATGTYSTGNADTVTVQLMSQGSPGNGFPVGSYSATVVVTCS